MHVDADAVVLANLVREGLPAAISIVIVSPVRFHRLTTSGRGGELIDRPVALGALVGQVRLQ